MSDKYPGGFVTANAPAGFSVYTNGSGSGPYIRFGSSAALTFGTGDFTIEFWVNFLSINDGTINYLYDMRNANGTGSFFVGEPANTWTYRDGAGNAVTTGMTSSTFTANQWYHVAVCRASGVINFYINGTKVSSNPADTSNYATSYISIMSRHVDDGGANNTNAYTSNFRIVNGTALYTANFTPPTQLLAITNTALLTCQNPTITDNSTNALTPTIATTNAPTVSNFTPFAAYQGFNPALGAAAGGVWTIDEAAYYQQNRLWPIYDPYFKNTTLMLHGNGTNAAQNNTFLDSSTNNFTITRNGNTTQGSFSPFSQTGWSVNFDSSATTDAITFPSTSSYSIGTGNFTVEFWYNPSSFGSSQQRLFIMGTGGTTNLSIESQAASSLTIQVNTANLFSYSWSPAIGSWYHIALCRVGTTVTLYINGVAVASATSSASISNNTVNVGSLTWASGYNTKGYLSNVRFSSTTAFYTSNFTPSTQPLTAITGTALLTCQSQRFVDNSALNATATVTGTPSTQAFSPFVPAYITPTTYSNYFDGSGDYLTASGAGLALGAGNFTVEGWFYTTGYNTGEALYSGLNTYPASTGLLFYINGSGTYTVDVNGSNVIASGTAPLNTWTHVALVRSSTGSNGLALYINGVSIATGTTANDFTSTYAVIGRTGFGAASNFWLGCLSNIRVLVGTALYTASFTPPTAPLTNITNTSLLTCQSSTFIDNSTANGGSGFTITANGNVQPVTSPTPFPAKVDTTTLNSAYSTSLIGGSGYFDGTGDSLSVASATAFALPGDFSCEFWVYFTGTPQGGGASQEFITVQVNGGFVIGINSTTIYVARRSIGNDLSVTVTQTSGQWMHIAVCRVGTTMSIFKNGIRVATGTVSSSYAQGNFETNSGNLGYLSGLRLLKGSSAYDPTTTGFVPPLAPPTPVTNTQLLLNYTNGAIFDNTAKNVLETVGNAQISTTQSKWGGSSMYFDGTGDYAKFQTTSAANYNFTFGSSDFTIEMWVYPSNTSSVCVLVGQSDNATIAGGSFLIRINGNVDFYSGGTAYTCTGASPAANQWSHIAYVRNGTSLKTYLNGTQAGSTTLPSSTTAMNVGSTTYPPILGAFSDGSGAFTGYIDDVRITKGVARYITNFTPPTSQLQDQ